MKNVQLIASLIILFVISFPSRIFSIDDNQLITELKVFDNDTTYRFLYLYDNQGHKVLETKFYLQNNSWLRSSQNEWLYDGNKCITQRERIWRNFDWEDAYVIDYEFVNDKLISEIHKTYTNGVAFPVKKTTFQNALTTLTSKSEYFWHNDVWSLSQVTGFTYLTNGKTDSIKTSVYQSGNNLKQIISTFTYNPDGTLGSQLLKQKNGNNDWLYTDLINWYYKPNTSLVLFQRNKKWLAENSSWENTQNVEFQYNLSNQLISEIYQRWKTMFWDNDTRYDYRYDNNGNQTKKIISFPIYHQWRSLISINYSDFIGNKANLMESKFEFWGGNTGELTTSYIPYMFNNEIVIQKGKSVQVSYLSVIDSTLSNRETRNLHFSIPIYPNPSKGIFYINTQEYGVLSWSVSDLSGRLLGNHVQSFTSGVIDLTDYPKGIYLLKVITNDAQFTQKLIKE